jgi:hypothetical protein
LSLVPSGCPVSVLGRLQMTWLAEALGCSIIKPVPAGDHVRYLAVVALADDSRAFVFDCVGK